jgi:hypothetical protein
LGELGSKTPKNAKLTVAAIGRKHRRTPTEFKNQSIRMKKYRAAKRAKAAKAKKPTLPKPKPEKAPVGKAISNAMRISGAKKKAKDATNKAKTKPNKLSQKPL